ncbi:MAG: hypothetical protein QFX33_00570 [Candidatus Nezhaarchaeota archaeon]|nr:hypothetical protein [Candidatus Nezhaarchaeota archaeon]
MRTGNPSKIDPRAGTAKCWVEVHPYSSAQLGANPVDVELLFRGLLYLGEHRVVRESQSYKLYLPRSLNDLWDEVSKRKIRVEVYVILKDRR